MKHAAAGTLATIEPLLAAIRTLPGLIERRPGIFYLKSRAYLHFHEDPAGIFADARLSEDFERFAVNTPREQAAFFELLAVNRGVPVRDRARRGVTLGALDAS